MSAVGQANPFSDASEYNTLDFIIARATDKMQTVSIGQVIAVNTGAQTVDVQILVNLVTGANTPVEHEVIANRPYFRLQGGGNAIICDPVVGDIGVVVFASRDITGVVAAKSAANPSSNRRFSWSDGIYLGGVLNGTPTQYMQFLAAGGGINIVSPGTVAIQAPATTASGTLNVTGNTTLQATLAVTGTSVLTGGVSAPGGITVGAPTGGAAAPGTINATGLFVNGVAVSTGGGGGGGTVTSVGISTPGVGVVVGGGPVTTAGTLTVDLSSTAYAALALAVTALQSISIATGTGLTGGPLAASGSTVALANTAVTPGSYTSANITVDAQGRLTAASNGGVSSGTPGTIADLLFWLKTDIILGTNGVEVLQLQNSTPWIGGVLGYVTSGRTARAATVSAAQLNSLNTLTWLAGNTTAAVYTLPNAVANDPSGLGACTFFIVANGSTAAGTQAIFGGATSAIAFYLSNSGGSKLALVKTGASVIGTATAAWTPGTWFQANATYTANTGAFAFRQGRATNGSGTGATAAGTGAWNAIGADLGTNFFNNGSIAELIVYNRVLSGPEITAVENYLFAKWGV